MYQVIARKYRPQSFDSVVGQEHVKRTIANAVDHGRTGHGYIFSGPRGTGKTTMARILAMALNCENGPSSKFDVAADPICKEIAANNSMDVVEIDAASNRRIDDIRELRESVRYRPARDRYKIFIIDEAHQITTDAFNALLKTLEEPPEWVVFVLCTTEPQAIPATIQSRCQSFQFRTVDLDQTVARMQWICEQEGVDAEEDALVAVALAGDGSIRDSLSTLDQAIASCGKTLKADEVRDLLGAIPSEVTRKILNALSESDAPAMLDIVDGLFRAGRHPQHFVGELCRQFRNLLVMKVSGADTRLVTAGANERRQAAEALESFSAEDLTRYVQLLLDLYRDLQQASQPRFRMELGLLKLVHVGRLRSIEEILSGAPPSTTPQVPPQTPPGKPPSTPVPRASSKPAAAAPAPAKAPPPPAPKPPAPEPAGDLRSKLVQTLRDSGEDFFAEAIQHSAVEEKAGRVSIRATPADRTTLELGGLEAIEAALRKIPDAPVKVELGAELADAETAEAAPAAASPAPESPLESEVARRALADPDVQAFQQRFRGQVRDVRDLREYTS